ncbi:UbiA family prenyltransferase [Kitasatospora sp. NPDC094015]|uniref:UbiA family prenyltransferase n=1 Tax=Kitasatospora sp. NPDC094015 TaxID=3155205 RepID=UPI0033275F12
MSDDTARPATARPATAPPAAAPPAAARPTVTGPTVTGPTRTALTLLLACHPAPAAAVTGFATALAAACGRGPAGSLLVGAAVAAGQLSVGWSNDLIDQRRDRAAGRRDKPLAAGQLTTGQVRRAAGWALSVCVPLSLASGPAAGAAHLAGVAAAWAYNLGLKRTVLSWAPYALAFGLLPAFVTLGLPDARWPQSWVTVAAALLGTGAHFANVLPDLDDDLAAGVRGLPQRLGRARAGAAAAVLLGAASAVLVTAPPGPPGAAGRAALAATALLVLPALLLPRTRWPFLAALGVAGIDLVLLLARGAALA